VTKYYGFKFIISLLGKQPGNIILTVFKETHGIGHGDDNKNQRGTEDQSERET